MANARQIADQQDLELQPITRNDPRQTDHQPNSQLQNQPNENLTFPLISRNSSRGADII